MDWLSDAGSWASIVSLPVSAASTAASIYAAFRIDQVRRRVVFGVRADGILDEIESGVRSITELLREIPGNRRQIEIDLRTVVGLISRLRSILPPDTRANVSRIERVKRQYSSINDDSPIATRKCHDLLWEAVAELSLVIKFRRHVQADRLVGGSDAL